mmetsp:Transcript_20910/g.44512  ORF Transcript_20910/g.44512 Transcript_20910/m.44512 type:complete len:216 (+) Transcript_20910:116-763(+)
MPRLCGPSSWLFSRPRMRRIAVMTVAPGMRWVRCPLACSCASSWPTCTWRRATSRGPSGCSWRASFQDSRRMWRSSGLRLCSWVGTTASTAATRRRSIAFASAASAFSLQRTLRRRRPKVPRPRPTTPRCASGVPPGAAKPCRMKPSGLGNSSSQPCVSTTRRSTSSASFQALQASRTLTWSCGAWAYAAHVWGPRRYWSRPAESWAAVAKLRRP